MLTTIIGGLAIGAIYAIVAYGYNVTWTASGVLNFANAYFLVLGSFIAGWAATSLGFGVVTAVALCIAVGVVVGLLVQLVAIAPLRSMKREGLSGGHAELVTTVGIGTIISGLIIVVWGTDPIRISLFDSESTQFTVFGASVRVIDALLIIVSILAGVALHFLTQKSKLGLASLAQSEDRETAMLQGINVRHLSLAAFGLAGGLMAGVGALVGIKTFAVVSVILTLAVKGFVALTIGGLGSQMGALVGGLGLGVAEALTARYIGPDFRNFTIIVIFVVALLIKPEGLFGKKEARTV